MTSVAEIESAIKKLPADEVDELMSWFEDYYNRTWDQRLEEDLRSGALDGLLREVDSEIEAGLSEPL